MIKLDTLYKNLFGIMLMACSDLFCESVCAQEPEGLSLQQAIESVLQQAPEIALQKQAIIQQRGNLQSSSGTFDYQFFSNLNFSQARRNVLPLPISTNFDRILQDTFGINTIKTDLSFLQSGVSRIFRNGLSAQAFVTIGRTQNDIPYPSPFEQFTAENATTARLQLGVPLLNNRNGRVIRAGEVANQQLLKRSEAARDFTITSQVVRTVLSYWLYLSAWQNLSIQQQAVDRARGVLEDSKLLIKAEKKPSADLIPVEGDLANKTSQLLLARQQYFNAQQNMGRSIGLDYQQSNELGMPVSVFPALAETAIIDQLSVQQFENSLTKRKDLEAQRQIVNVQQTLVDAAKQGRLPQLSLDLFTQHSGLQYGDKTQDYVSPFTASQGSSFDYGIGLSLRAPIQNNVAKGNHERSQASLASEKINLDNQMRNVRINLSVAINQLKISKDVLLQRKVYFEKSIESFENEKIKFQRGLTTLLNIIVFQDRLTFAELNYIQAQQLYASALANVRFESGTALQSEELEQNFYQIPITN